MLLALVLDGYRWRNLLFLLDSVSGGVQTDVALVRDLLCTIDFREC